MLLPQASGLYVLPSWCNHAVAAAVPLTVAVVYAVFPSPESCPTWTWALAGAVVDHAIGFEMLKPLLLPFLRANMRSTSDAEERADPGLHVARLASGVALAACVVHLVVHCLGRKMLLLTAAIRLLLVVQGGCWLSVLALRLQTDGLLPLMPGLAQRLLSASPLEHLQALKQALAAPRQPVSFPVSLSELVWIVRTLAPVVLAAEDESLHDDALRLLPPRLLDALEMPVACQLPRVAQSLIGPWADSDALRLKRGLPPGIDDSAAADAPAAEADGLDSATTPVGSRAPSPPPSADEQEPPRRRGVRSVDPRDLPSFERESEEPPRSSSMPRLVIPPLEARMAEHGAEHAPLHEGAAPPSPRSATGSAASGASNVSSALAPEILLLKLAANSVRRLAERRKTVYVSAARQLAVELLSGAQGLVARVVPASLVRVLGKVLGAGEAPNGAARGRSE